MSYSDKPGKQFSFSLLFFVIVCVIFPTIVIIRDVLLQGMTVYLYKLDALMYTYTILTVGQGTGSASEG